MEISQNGMKLHPSLLLKTAKMEREERTAVAMPSQRYLSSEISKIEECTLHLEYKLKRDGN